MSEQQPSPEAMEAARPFVKVKRQDGRYVISVGDGIVDDPIYELYNTERSANETAQALISAFASVLDEFAAKAVQEALDRAEPKLNLEQMIEAVNTDRERIVRGLEMRLNFYSSLTGKGPANRKFAIQQAIRVVKGED